MTYSASFALILIGISTVAGFFGALLGVGGGIFIVPAIVLGFHLPMKVAVATSIVSVIATSNAGGSSYVDQHITNLKLGMFLEIFTTAGAVAGSAFALVMQEWLGLLLFAGMLGVMAISAFLTRNVDEQRIASGAFAREPQDRASRALDLRGHYRDQALGRTVEYAITGVVPGGVVAFLAGVASGLLGVGGGVFKVFSMNRFMNAPMKVAVGTSKLMIGVTAAVSSILFFVAGVIPFLVVGPVALGTTAGATIGTMVMNRLHSRLLKGLIAVLMTYLGYGMVAKALAIRFHVHLPTLT